MLAGKSPNENKIKTLIMDYTERAFSNIIKQML